ncbi:MAG: hypothetical protein K0Q55_2108 [Verrucomicrobia bacterium]|jgi:hypothetical protein|nr:hypothetical protein [Verrucomicrobiota bacterium]
MHLINLAFFIHLMINPDKSHRMKLLRLKNSFARCHFECDAPAIAG